MTTVFLKTYEEYLEIKGSKEAKLDQKSTVLQKLLADGRENAHTKTLIYAGTYTEVNRLSALVCESSNPHATELLDQFSAWIRKNYSSEWELANLVTRRFGIHNGSLHRSLAQIQVKLFEEENGLAGLISTSSIIEGVNTAAERVVVWHNKNGQPKLTSFDYKNLAGRGGRMFRYFIGHVHILAEPPADEDAQITLDIPDNLLISMNEEEQERHLTKEQIAVIIAYKEELEELMTGEQMKTLLSGGFLQNSDYELAKKIVNSLRAEPHSWNQLRNLNSSDTSRWDSVLYKVQNLKHLGHQHRKIVEAAKVMALGWKRGLAATISLAASRGIEIDEFFKLERDVAFKLATLLHDINAINRDILGSSIDISPFAAKAAHAFLPVLVYQLEEYGLPRIVSRKIQDSGLIDLESEEKSIHEAISEFSDVGHEKIGSIKSLDAFDRYVLGYFYEGIASSRS